MKTSRQKKHRQGLAAVELAMLLPIFMMLLVGVMDMGRLYWTQSVVRDASLEGARTAILHESTISQIETVVIEELVSGGVDQTSSIVISDRQAEQPVEVKVSVPFEFYVIDGLIPSLAGSTDISAAATMTHER